MTDTLIPPEVAEEQERANDLKFLEDVVKATITNLEATIASVEGNEPRDEEYREILQNLLRSEKVFFDGDNTQKVSVILGHVKATVGNTGDFVQRGSPVEQWGSGITRVKRMLNIVSKEFLTDKEVIGSLQSLIDDLDAILAATINGDNRSSILDKFNLVDSKLEETEARLKVGKK